VSAQRTTWRQLAAEHSWAAWLVWSAWCGLMAVVASARWVVAIDVLACAFGAFLAGAEIARKNDIERAERLALRAGETGHVEVIRVTVLRGQNAAMDFLADASQVHAARKRDFGTGAPGSEEPAA